MLVANVDRRRVGGPSPDPDDGEERQQREERNGGGEGERGGGEGGGSPNAPRKRRRKNNQADALRCDPVRLRTHVATTTTTRVGQKFFRDGLRDQYESVGIPVRCAVTGVPLVQAAHVDSSGSKVSDKQNVGVFFSPTVHELYDRSLLSFSTDTLDVRMAPEHWPAYSGSGNAVMRLDLATFDRDVFERLPGVPALLGGHAAQRACAGHVRAPRTNGR